MSDVLTTREVARALGYSYEYFRKHWRALVAGAGFPNPFRLGAWEAEAVFNWRRARTAGDSCEPTPARPVSAERARRQVEDLRAA